MAELIKKKKFFLQFFYDWIIPIICAIILAFLINKFLVFQIKIPSESMVPTLEVGDRLFASRVYKEDSLNKGDLIIFYSKERNELVIKRLIGLPNDKIVIDNGIVRVNGEVLNEYYIQNQDYFTGEYTVPEGKYCFLGDNRGNSFDSRYWTNKYIDFNDIEGKAFVKVFPFDDFGFIN